MRVATLALIPSVRVAARRNKPRGGRARRHDKSLEQERGGKKDQNVMHPRWMGGAALF